LCLWSAACAAPAGSAFVDAGRLDGSVNDAGASPVDGGNDAGSVSDPDAGPVSSYESVSVSSAVTKVKNLLTGLPATEEEVAQVTADHAALTGLVGQWMARPEYAPKMQAFLANAFQQTQLNPADLGAQFNQDIPYARNAPQAQQDFEESFARTAMALIAEGRPFTETMTTRRFMMTPALMAAYALIDAVPVNDLGKSTDVFARTHPTTITLESTRMIPIESAIDPTNADYMHFYDSTIATSFDPDCPSGTIVYNSPASTRDLASIVLSRAPFNFLSPVAGAPPGHRCNPPAIPQTEAYVTNADYTTWKWVTIRAPQTGEATTRFYDLPTLRTASELVLNVPRVGFFTTPSFLAQWSTNQSNQARVTVNQTMIVGLGAPIDTSTAMQATSLAALDSVHAPADSTCFACHQSLDPMRQYFRQAYTLNFSAQTATAQTSLPGQFAFQGVTASGTSIFDLGSQLAGHPAFAAAWVQKLCTYATSAPCDDSDPEFLRLVSVFIQSNYSWNALVQALFSSPIVTYLQDTQTADTMGETYPIARQQHLCTTLSNRLGITDVCGLDANHKVANGLKVVQTIAASWPSDQYSRGNPTAVLANSPSLFMRTGMENICSALATYLVDNATTGQYQSTNVPTALQGFTTGLMGLTSDRAPEVQAVLQSHFDAARQGGATASAALKSTFVLACLSPYVIGVGQ
jgi:hypothetical protein